MDCHSQRASREEPPSTLLARVALPTGMFVGPTILKVAPPPRAARILRDGVSLREHPDALIGVARECPL